MFSSLVLLTSQQIYNLVSIDRNFEEHFENSIGILKQQSVPAFSSNFDFLVLFVISQSRGTICTM